MGCISSSNVSRDVPVLQSCTQSQTRSDSVPRAAVSEYLCASMCKRLQRSWRVQHADDSYSSSQQRYYGLQNSARASAVVPRYRPAPFMNSQLYIEHLLLKLIHSKPVPAFDSLHAVFSILSAPMILPVTVLYFTDAMALKYLPDWRLPSWSEFLGLTT